MIYTYNMIWYDIRITYDIIYIYMGNEQTHDTEYPIPTLQLRFLLVPAIDLSE